MHAGGLSRCGRGTGHVFVLGSPPTDASKTYRQRRTLLAQFESLRASASTPRRRWHTTKPLDGCFVEVAGQIRASIEAFRGCIRPTARWPFLCGPEERTNCSSFAGILVENELIRQFVISSGFLVVGIEPYHVFKSCLPFQRG